MKVGIDAIHFYVPQTYLPIEALAAARNIEYAKLNKGLGLEAMALPDLKEDVATMAAQAVLQLLQDQNIDPRTLDRLYLGTESALDAAKATASYVAQIVEQKSEKKYGPRALQNCDAVDLTFACIGGVDALENALDFVRANPKRKAVVVASDLAKYDLESTGEYTQGAGAVAMLVKAEPRLLAFNKNIGVALNSVSDFFKPRRTYPKTDLLQEAARLLGTSLSAEDARELLASHKGNFWNDASANLEVHKEEPVFDGPYSNTCYQERITEALENFSQKQEIKVLERWQKLVFHLPYAYQGRRMITASWMNWMKEAGRQAELQDALKDLGLEQASVAQQIKGISKSEIYRAFVTASIAQGEKASSLIGNMYTGSIFMSLLSLLQSAQAEKEDLTRQRIGLFAYGSGSKAKVLEAQVQSGWQTALKGVTLFETLANRQAISFEQYESWHKGTLVKPFVKEQAIQLQKIGEKGETLGYRYY
jgi:hydroxymethylglutaryl-CoA synthase